MRQRNLIFVTVMSIITFGIYDLYWIFSTRNELVKKGQAVPSPLIVLLPLLALIVVAIMQIFVHFILNSASSDSVITLLNVLSVIVGIVSVLAIIPVGIFWTWRYSQAVGKVTKGDLTAEVCFVVALVTNVIGFGWIWPIFTQYYFNKLTKA